MIEEDQTETADIEDYDEEIDIPASYVFQRVYRFFYSKYVGLLLILVTAILAFLGAIIVQAPSGLFNDSNATQDWLDNVRPRYGGWTSVLYTLGFFNLYSSAIFLTVTTLLTLSIIACTTHRLGLLWRQSTKPRIHVSDKFISRARKSESFASEAKKETIEQVILEVLHKRRFRVLNDDKVPDTCIGLYADRSRFGPFGTVIAHISFVMILVGFMITSIWGLEVHLEIPIGDSVPVAQGKNLALKAISFTDKYDENGRPLDYASHLQLYQDGVQVKEQDVRVNSPLNYGRLSFHQSSFGIAALVTVKDQKNQILVNTAIPLKWNSEDGKEQIGRCDIPGKNLEIIVVTPASNQVGSKIPAGEAIFEIYNKSDTERLGTYQVSMGKPETAGDLTLTFEREKQYTDILIRRDPGRILVWTGFVLLMVGMIITFGMKHRRIWVRVVPDPTGYQVKIVTVDKPDTFYERKFCEIAKQIEEKIGQNHESIR